MGECKGTVHARCSHWLPDSAALTANANAWLTAQASRNGQGRIQARNQIGSPGGRRVFCKGTKFFKLFPMILNYVQHIFTGGSKIFVGGIWPPWLWAWPDLGSAGP